MNIDERLMNINERLMDIDEWPTLLHLYFWSTVTLVHGATTVEPRLL